MNSKKRMEKLEALQKAIESIEKLMTLEGQTHWQYATYEDFKEEYYLEVEEYGDERGMQV